MGVKLEVDMSIVIGIEKMILLSFSLNLIHQIRSGDTNLRPYAWHNLMHVNLYIYIYL